MEENIRGISGLLKRSSKRHFLFFLILLGFSLFLIKFNQVDIAHLVQTEGRTFERAKVVKILEDNIQEDGTRVGQQKVLLKMLSGSQKGSLTEAISNNGYLFGAACRSGLKVIVIQSISGDIAIHTVYSPDRVGAVVGFILIFLLVVCLVGGKKGVLSCLGLLFTFLCIMWLYIPMIYKGYSPFLAAVLVAGITTFMTMYLLGGWCRKTVCAAAGTISGVIIAGISAFLFGKAAHISGYNVSNIEALVVLENIRGIRVGELLFSGLLISSLGAVMDVGMSIASTVFEIHGQKPELTRWELFRSGMNVGKDAMGTMVNTLILAYVGSGVSTLLLNYAYELPFLQIINSNNILIEIMQGISGSMGVVLTVPMVSFFSSYAAEAGYLKKQVEKEG
ncbi:YibE/F family protein [Clostridium sp. E02]|uniref:YibE/F family protein n=1 Tax=Clostridium sp. E02 TaxID=2487134 RepID=UPI000F541DBF|nr:YibE/F family protein [Clostridium sp. E02]